MPEQKFIVVGVDGSDAATAALRWACGEAATYGATIEVVHAFRRVAGPLSAVEDAGARSLRLLSREVWVALATVKNPPPIRLSNQPGDPAPVLISRSSQARLLVLGAAGDADTDSPGSIAAICQQNAQCPVAVIGRPGQLSGHPHAQQRVPQQRPFPRYAVTAPPDGF